MARWKAEEDIYTIEACLFQRRKERCGQHKAKIASHKLNWHGILARLPKRDEWTRKGPGSLEREAPKQAAARLATDP